MEEPQGKYTGVQVFDAAGCVAPAAPSCAACLGGPKDTFARMNEPQVCVSTTNRRAAAPFKKKMFAAAMCLPVVPSGQL